MSCVRDRWLSKRAVSLHVAALVAVPACAVAAWWQVNRAQDGNDLSYLYSVMWPVFGVLAVVFWWMLIHTDYDTVGLKGMKRQQAASPAPPPGRADDSVDPIAADDPELAAYNARLAALASEGPKTWRNRESVVVRRTP
jgi:DNA-binding transcriptional regulator of glucitol operon